jgi:Phage gp6-like head-tail connector protein
MRLVPITSLNGTSAITQVTATGTLSSASAVVTGIANTSLLTGALGVSGPGIPANTYAYSIDSSSQVTLNQPATQNGAQSLVFNIEPITLPEAKLHARIEYPDDDALVAGLIRAARRYCETALKSAILTQTWILYLDSFPSAGGYYNRAVREVWPSLGGMPSGLGFYPGLIPNSTGVIDIPLPPLQSITSVQYYDFQGVLQTYPSANYNVSLGTPARIQPQYSLVWPISRPTIDSVLITFVAGQAATADKVDDNIKIAMKLCVAHWYENREWVSDGSFMTVPHTVDDLLSPSDPGIYA